MKTPTRLLLALLICASITAIFFYNRARAATTYTWNQTGTASWATAGNWSPARTTPAVDDVLVFNNGATTTVTNIPTQTIGQLSVSGNTTVNLQANAALTVLTIAGDVGTDLSVASGSALNMTGANTMTITLAAAATGSMSGNMICSTAASRLDAATASAITFNSGAIVTQAAGCTGNLFTAAGTANAIVFASGSTMIQQTGANPFGLAAPNSKVIFQTGSLFSFRQNAAPGFSGRTYADLEFNFATYNQTSAGGGAFVVDNLSVVLGVAHLQLTNVTIKGNISVAAGQTLDFNPTAPAAIGLAGTTPQTVTNSGTLTFNSNANITVSNASGVTLNSAVTWSGTNVVNAGAALATAATLTNNGTTTINGTFQLNNGGVAAGANEFVYGATGSLIYNQSGPAYLVDFVDVAWPFTGPFNVTVQNSGGVTLNDFRDVNGTLSLLNGNLGNAFNLNLGNGATIVRRAGGAFAGGSPGFDTNVNVIYDGTAPLTTGVEIPTSSSILKTLVVTNTGGVTLGASATANAASSIGAGATLNTGAFTFTMSGATLTNSGSMIIMGAFRLNQGGFAAGNDFAYTPGTSALVFNNTSGSFAVNGTPAYWPVANGPFNVIVQGSGGITTNVPRAVNGLFQYAAGVSNMANLTLNGVSQVNAGGFTSGSPTYGATSLLKYNTGGTYGRNGEWLPNASGGAGYPASVQLSNNTTLDLPNSSFTLPFQMGGSLTIDSGSTLQLAGSTPMQAPLRVLGNLVNNGTLNLSSSSGGDLEVRGDWTNSGIFNNNGRTVTLNGASGQTVSGNATFFNLSKTTATAQTLTFAAGSTQTVTNSLSLTGASGNLLSLRSTISGTQWKLKAPATQSVSFVDVKDSDASGGSLVNTISSVDSGNNINWNFPAAPAPEIAVEEPAGNDLSIGALRDFGNQAVATTSAPKTFTIKNMGTANLNITNITKTGAQAAEFTVSPDLTGAVVTPGNSTTFNVTFTPAALTLRQATIHINSNDADEGSFDIDLQGTGVNADYTITASALAVVVTDLSGNSDTLTVNEPGPGLIKFAAPGRFFSVNGGLATSGDSGNIGIPSVTTITVNQGAGNDIYNMGAFSITMPSLQINGGTGDDTVNLNGSLTFGATRMLDIDLQDDSATPGVDSVNIATNAQIFMTTTGAATIRASRNFTMASGSTLQVENGAMIIETNLQASPTSGDFNGVDVSGGSIFTVGSGNVVINGKGGAGDFIENIGVTVSSGGQIASTNSGTLAVQGTGGAGSGSASAGQGNLGVYVTGSGSTIKSAASATQITGFGGTTNDSNVVGVVADELGTLETDGAGALTINGTGGTVNGGGPTFVNSAGVFVVVGDVNGDGGFVKSTGTGVNAGNLIITGTATNGGNGSAQGVRVDAPASVTTVDGHISITGTSAACGNACLGVSIRGDVTATGNANITIDGTGGASSGVFPVHGVNVRSTGNVAAVNGDIAILATGGSSTGTDNAGFDIGTPATGTLQTTGSGRIIVSSDNIRINPAATNATINAGANIVSLRQRTNSISIDLGASSVVPAAGTLELSDLELDRVTAGQINIGNSNTGPINVTQPITRAAATNINPTSNANITLATNGSINTGGGSFSPLPGTNFFPGHAGVDVNTGANTTLLAQTLLLNINNTTVDTGYTQLNLVGLVNLNNAALQLGGSHVPVAGQQFIIVNNDSNDPIAGTFIGLPEGAIINNFLVAGMKAKISYVGGDGNDAVLTVQACPTSFTVNSNLDTVDADPGDNICATAGAVCTLRAAIQEANTGGACGPIDINFSIPTSTITVFSVLAISHSVNINGPVASSITVAGTAPVPTRVFQVSANTTVNISNLTVSGGRATVGAGLLALGPNSTTTLNGMLFTGNIAIDPAGFAGGGGAASGNGGTLNIRNSTFSGNTGTHGGAVSVQGNNPLNLVNVTITANLADGNTGTGPCPIGGSVDGDGGGIQGSTMPAPFLSMRNSIVAFNQDCNANNPNVTGLIIDQGNNITVNDPSLNLGPLQNNGGPTFTYGLLAFSTAIDAGNDCVFTNTCVPALGVSLTNDQRGPAFPRQVNGDTVPAAHVDIGAFEKQSPSAANSVISGRIVDSGGTPVEGAAVRLSGAQDRLTVTDKEGNYRFEAVATNALYTVTPSRANFSFRPGDRTFTQLGNHTDALFTANATGAGANPLDTTEYFVRQQYIDFLGREPDEAGLSFWVNNINACGANALCRSAKREDTSAAFFLSIEFHETGYLVYRAYQTAYGEIPGAPVPVTLAEFQPDAALLEDNLIVNAPGWQAKLEANKQAYFAAFVARSRFASVYADSLTPAEFVDRLFTNRGRMQSAHERDAAIAEFANAADSSDLGARAHALRLIAENRELDLAKLNRAFVLMQYFGYLGRDPDALPDGDFSGYDFWLQKLEEFHGDWNRAEMVKAFLVSGEYRGRFPR